MENIGAVLVDNVQTARETQKKQQTSSAAEGFLAMFTAMLGLGNAQTNPSTTAFDYVDFMSSLTDSPASLVPTLSENLVEDNTQNVAAELMDKNNSQFDIANFLKAPNSVVQADLSANAASIEQQNENVLQLENENKLQLQNENQQQNIAESPQDELMFEEAIDNAAEHNKQTQELFGQADNEMLVQKDEQLPENVFLKNVGEALSNANEQPDEVTMDAKRMTKDLPEIVISKFKTMTKADGAKELVVQLEPKELGKLVVKLTSIEGTVSVKILAHAPVTRELLETGLGSLRQSFAEQGIRFDRMDVELGGEQLNQSFYEHQQHEQEPWQHSKWLGKSGAYYETEDYFGDELQEMTDLQSQLPSGTYDYLV